MTWLLTEGLVGRGHDVTLFATGDSTTSARLHARFPGGYVHDRSMWPWEMYEILNHAAAVERASDFDLVHCHAVYQPLAVAFARLARVPLVQTVHHMPSPTEAALWASVPEIRFTAISESQARQMTGVAVAGVAHHGVDLHRFPFVARPEGFLLFLGRFTAGKGVLDAIEIARRADRRLVLAGPANEYFEQEVAARVDGERIVWVGEAGPERKAQLLGAAAALLYPLREPEPFGMVLIEAMACGTPVAALDRGAVREVVTHGSTGGVFADVDTLTDGLGDVLALDRRAIREVAERRFSVDAMVDAYFTIYERVVHGHRP